MLRVHFVYLQRLSEKIRGVHSLGLCFLPDRELPVLVCDPDREVGTDPGQDYATISWTTPTASDNMDNGLQVTVSRQPGRFTIGTHTVTASATDSSGNTGTCSWTYVVRGE